MSLNSCEKRTYKVADQSSVAKQGDAIPLVDHEVKVEAVVRVALPGTGALRQY